MKENRLSHRDERIINGTSNKTHGESQGPATHGSERTDSEDKHYEGLNNAWNNMKTKEKPNQEDTEEHQMEAMGWLNAAMESMKTRKGNGAFLQAIGIIITEIQQTPNEEENQTRWRAWKTELQGITNKINNNDERKQARYTKRVLEEVQRDEYEKQCWKDKERIDEYITRLLEQIMGEEEIINPAYTTEMRKEINDIDERRKTKYTDFKQRKEKNQA